MFGVHVYSSSLWWVKRKEVWLWKTSGPGIQLKFSLLLLSTNSEHQPIRRLRSFCALQLFNVPSAAERRRAGDAQLKRAHQTDWMHSFRRKESVCRNLFGPVDHEQLRRDLKLRLGEMMDQDRRCWNFDFQTETPLSGRFQWKEIPAALYHDSTPLREGCASKTEGEEDRLIERKCESGTDQENCSSISNRRRCSTDGTPARRKRTRSKSAAKLGNYARITGEKHKKTRFTHVENILDSN